MLLKIGMTGLSSVYSQGGAYLSTVSTVPTTITFPVSFSNGSIPAVTINSSLKGGAACAVNSLTNVSFATWGDGASVHYIAIGH